MATEFVENIGDTRQAKVNPLMTRENLMSSMIGIVIAIVVLRVFITSNVFVWSFGGVALGGTVGLILSIRARGLSVLDLLYLAAHRRIMRLTSADYVLPHGESFYDAAAHDLAPTFEFMLDDEAAQVEFV